jgi:hypothetical protein
MNLTPAGSPSEGEVPILNVFHPSSRLNKYAPFIPPKVTSLQLIEGAAGVTLARRVALERMARHGGLGICPN